MKVTVDDLSMAHDNLQRELSDIKRLMGKDKHALIKSNIVLNKRVQELERANKQLEKQAPGIELDLLNMELTDALKQNKRYREVIKEIKKTSDDYRAGHFLDIQDSFFVDEIIAIIDNLECEE